MHFLFLIEYPEYDSYITYILSLIVRNMKERLSDKDKKPGAFDAVMNGNTMQLVFFVMLTIVFFLAIPFFMEYGKIVRNLKEGNPNYQWPEYVDLSIAFFSMLILLGLRELTLKYGSPIADRMLKPTYQGTDRQERIERMLIYMFKSLYFLVVVIAGWYISKDADWYPKVLLGHGDTSVMYKGWPYIDNSTVPNLGMYQMIQLGFHAHILVTHFTENPKKNYIEMLLHHTLTILLIVLGYFFNMHNGASMTLLVHDVSDIFVSAARAMMDTNYKGALLFFYAMLMITWGYLRLYVFPFHLVFPTMWSTDFDSTNGLPGFYIMSSMANFLLFMHFYWFFMLGKIGYGFIVNKKLKDLVEEANSKDKDQ